MAILRTKVLPWLLMHWSAFPKTQTQGNLCNQIPVPKVPLQVFDKLKNKIQTFIIIFCFYVGMKNEIQIIDYYSCVKIDFYFEFLMLSFVLHFHKKWKTKYSLLFVFHFHERIEK